MQLQCHGEHRWLAPIRPIALTFCDVVSLARENRLLAAALAGIVILLLVYVHLTAAHLESQSLDLIYSLIKAYLSKKVTGIAYQGVLHWALSNGTFYVFRLCAFLVAYAAYDLGRDRVFALSLLLGLILIGVLALGLLTDGSPTMNAQLGGWALVYAACIGWFWSRYMSPRNNQHRSFDFDVGAALVRLSPR